jgi:hypothetical protein
MKQLLLFFGFLFLLQTGEEHERVLKLDIKVSQIELGEAGYFYVVEGNKITMYKPDGEIEYAYSNFYTTKLHSIDVSNPEKILLFYKQDQKITLLNKYFRTEPDPFFLKEKKYENISAACLSSDDNIWIFDESEQHLIKLTDEGEFITQGEKLPKSAGAPIQSSFMVDYGGDVYIADASKGILIFNAVGKYQQTIPLKGIKQFRIYDNKLYYTLGLKANIYDLKSGKQNTFDMPVRPFKTATIALEGDNLMMYVADPNKLDVIKMPIVEK